MLLPFTRAWTSFQKWLIIAAAVSGLAAAGALIYCYERYYRGPDDSALFGTWEEPRPGEGLLFETETGEIKEDPLTIYYRLNPDHTFEFLGDLADEETAFMRGTWHAGGNVVYLNLRWEDASHRKLIFWRIEELSSNELRIRYNPRGRLHTFKRVRLASPNASNQAMQRTASKPATDASSVCHPPSDFVARFPGLAVADLVSR